MYFYEIHEGDDDLMSDVILACESEVPPDEFLGLVEQVRAEIEETFEEDSLIEAIAVELERSHGFVFVSDDRLVASVRIAHAAADDRLIGTDAAEDEGEDEFDDDAELAEQTDYLTILADFDRGTLPD